MLNIALIGVMRFLQMEWHRHERDRNAWQIERAEMKSRIGKLEGDGRTSKRLQESLGKHVKILENALRRERDKAKAPPVRKVHQSVCLNRVLRKYRLTTCSSAIETSRLVHGR